MPSSTEPTPLGSALKELRASAGLTQEELAERAGISVRCIQALECGESSPRRDTIERLAGALGLDAAARARLRSAARPARRRASVGADRSGVPAVPAAITGADSPAANGAAPRRGESPRGGLPAPLTTFVGREAEVARLTRLIGSAESRGRLVSLTGPAGCGKSRLALEVAAALLSSVDAGQPAGSWLPDDAALVELDSVSDPALVPRAVAGALRVRVELDQPPTAAICEVARPLRLLLVLDGCEHLVDACARLASTLLRACPGVRILATGQQGLGIAGEVTWAVPPLAVPGDYQDGPIPDPATLLSCESVRLFVQRATEADPHFTLTETSAPAVARLCRRLEGMPLALELAAARTRVLTVEAIERRLDDCFRVLTVGSRTAAPRQQTLRAAIDWSYGLLGASERAFLDRLGTFADGFALDAAEAVWDGDDALDLLSRVVDKSLVLAEGSHGEKRYRLIETIRQYARERLVASGEWATVRERHARYYMGLALASEAGLLDERRDGWLQRLADERGNVRVALDWWIEAGDVESGLRHAAALWAYWLSSQDRGEGQERLRSLLAIAGASISPETRAVSLVKTGALVGAADFAAALADMKEGIALWRELSSPDRLASSLRELAAAARAAHDYLAAQVLLEEALALCRDAGDLRGAALTLVVLAAVAYALGNLADARTRYAEVEAIAAELGEPSLLATLPPTPGVS